MQGLNLVTRLMHGNVKRKNFIWERIIQTRFSSLLVFLRYMAFSQQLVVHRHGEHKAEATEAAEWWV